MERTEEDRARLSEYSVRKELDGLEATGEESRKIPVGLETALCFSHFTGEFIRFYPTSHPCPILEHCLAWSHVPTTTTDMPFGRVPITPLLPSRHASSASPSRHALADPLDPLGARWHPGRGGGRPARGRMHDDPGGRGATGLVSTVE